MLSALRSWLLISACIGLLWSDSAGGAEKIRLGLSTRNVVLMPFYYAKDKKFLDKYGLTSRSYKSGAICSWPG